MARHRLYGHEPKYVRDKLREARDLSNEIHRLEKQLIGKLIKIDINKFYVRMGCNSLRGFCIKDLKFTRTQGQRIATEVRRARYCQKLVEQDSVEQDSFSLELDGRNSDEQGLGSKSNSCNDRYILDELYSNNI